MALSNNQKFIVTGAAGFIGSALIWELNRRGIDNIIACDRLSDDDKWKNLMPLNFSDFVDADDLIKWVERKGEAFGKVNFVFHLGACSSTTERDAGYLMKNNFGYTKSLVRWAVNNRSRFIYASSAATYGDGSLGMSDKVKEELFQFRPLNMYGFSKHLFDCYARRKGIGNGILGLKYFNIFGPNENHKGDMRSVVSKAFDQIRQTGRVQLFKSYHPDFGDGQQMRDFLYVKDAVAMTLFLAEQPVAGGLFNVGSGQAATWLQLVEAIFASLGMPPQVEFIDMPEAVREHYQYYTQADISRLREVGYRHEITPLAEAVRDYVQNYLLPGVHLGDGEGVVQAEA